MCELSATPEALAPVSVHPTLAAEPEPQFLPQECEQVRATAVPAALQLLLCRHLAACLGSGFVLDISVGLRARDRGARRACNPPPFQDAYIRWCMQPGCP